MTREFAANVTFNGGEMEASPLRAEAYFLVYFQNFPESSSHSNQARKKRGVQVEVFDLLTAR